MNLLLIKIKLYLPNYAMFSVFFVVYDQAKHLNVLKLIYYYCQLRKFDLLLTYYYYFPLRKNHIVIINIKNVNEIIFPFFMIFFTQFLFFMMKPDFHFSLDTHIVNSLGELIKLDQFKKSITI
jgi:hypothetical protein